MQTIRISEPVDLAAVIPYQLGFHPERSLVLVGLRGQSLGLTARVDLIASAEDAVVAAPVLVDHLVADGCSGVILACYESRAGEATVLAEAVADALPTRGLVLVEHLVVRSGRVYFPGCTGDCHPKGGEPLPPADRAPAVAELVALGRGALPGRSDVQALVFPDDVAARDRVAAAVARLGRARSPRTGRAKALRDWASLLTVDGDPRAQWEPSAAAAARMAVSLRDVRLRDLVAAWICPGTLPLAALDERLVAQARALFPTYAGLDDDLGLAGSVDLDDLVVSHRQARLTDRLCVLARRVPDAQAPAVLTVLASYAWWQGEGTLARLALDRALDLDPGYRLALLLEQMLDLAVRPSRSA
jgi:hypothetical protein